MFWISKNAPICNVYTRDFRHRLYVEAIFDELEKKCAFAHVKFKFSWSAMNVNTGVQVKIYDEEKCVYEHQTAESKENNLRTLLQNLRDMQSEVNNFLTTLIQRQNASGRAQSDLLNIIDDNNRHHLFLSSFFLKWSNFINFYRNDGTINFFGRRIKLWRRGGGGGGGRRERENDSGRGERGRGRGAS